MERLFERFTTGCARFAARPAMFALCLLLVGVGLSALVFGSDRFVNIMSLALSGLTLLLLPVLQATQNRDGAALQAKLDELIKHNDSARDTLIGLEHRPQHEIDEMRVTGEAADAGEPEETPEPRVDPAPTSR
jgi:low affinity Fe/Cu permease